MTVPGGKGHGGQLIIIESVIPDRSHRPERYHHIILSWWYYHITIYEEYNGRRDRYMQRHTTIWLTPWRKGNTLGSCRMQSSRLCQHSYQPGQVRFMAGETAARIIKSHDNQYLKQRDECSIALTRGRSGWSAWQHQRQHHRKHRSLYFQWLWDSR